MITVVPSETHYEGALEIRLLGNLSVRDAAGEPVDLGALRTRKTMDLLRLLALRVGEPVAAPILIQRLWPDVPEERGRASLRTAASTIRGVLGRSCVERGLGGLVLRGAWVDTVAFTTLAVESRICLREGRPARAIVAAREAEALYLHDFRADDDAASWVVTERNQLRAIYGRLLEDTAEAALSLDWFRDVEDLASRAITRDPFAERPVRALMTAFAATGQVERALRVFQRCRHALVEELGVDPSVQTDALHLSILRGDVTAPVPRPVSLVGRGAELALLVQVLRRAVDDGRCVVQLPGPSGSGRRRLVAEACRQVGLGWSPVDSRSIGRRRDAQVLVGSPHSILDEMTVDETTVDGDGRPDVPRILLVVISDLPDPEIRSAADERGWEHVVIELAPLDLARTAELTEAAFGGAASPKLLHEVFESTAGAPGSVVLAVRQMVRSARVVSTSEGLAVTEPGSTCEPSISASAMVARALEVLPPESHQVLHVLAVADTVLPLPAVIGLVGGLDHAAVRAALEMLVDVSILSSTGEGYGFRHPLASVAVRGWLRPSVRAAWYATVAESAAVPARARVAAWSRAGEPVRACRSALMAAADARADGLDGEAEELLELARNLAASRGLDLGDVLTRPGPAVATQEPSTAAAAVPTGSPPVDVDVDDVARELGLSSGTSCDEAETVVGAARRAAASVHGGPGSGDRFAALGILLAERVLVPSRSLDALDALVEDLPAHTAREDLLGDAEVLRWLPWVLLGHAATVRAPIEAAAARPGRPVLVRARLRRLALLAEHDLGCSSAHELAERAGPVGHSWRFLPFRLLVERRGLVLPRQQLPGDSMAGTPLFRQLHALAAADRKESVGHTVAALQVLRAAADDALETGCSLMLPEIAARLVILGCGTDLGQARSDFDVMDDAIGQGPTHPREHFLRFVARAHVRAAAGDPSGAATAADAAARIARGHGLRPLAREADAAATRFDAGGRAPRASRARRVAPAQASHPDQSRPITVPVTLDRRTGPTSRESTATSRESPRTKTESEPTEKTRVNVPSTVRGST